MSIIDLFIKNMRQILNRFIAPETNGQDPYVTDSHTLNSSSNNIKGECIEVDFKDLKENPMKVLFEDVMGLIEIKEGYLDKMFNSNIDSPVHVPSFYVAKKPINIELWKVLMNEKDRSPYSTRVEWDDYLLLLKTLKELTKIDFSFPTSIQWEYATSKCESVKMPSYNNKTYLSYISVGLYNRNKRIWYDQPEYDLPYQVLCSMGNGHEALYLFLATKDDLSSINYTKEEKKNVSDYIKKILYTHS